MTAAGLVAKRALEAAGGKAGEGAWAGLNRLAETVRRLFAGDRKVNESLDRLESEPSSPGRAEELAEVFEARLLADRAWSLS